MGGIGGCCCNQPCEPCTEQADLSTWSIYESIMGFVFSGSFAALNELTCNKCGTSCQRSDNEEVEDEYATVSDWGGWALQYRCGPCKDCTDPDDPIDLPPCPDDILTGGVNCPPGYPTYTEVSTSARNGFRVKFWLSKMVRVIVCVNYVETNQVQFSVQVNWMANIAETSSYGTQRRYKREVKQCTYDTLISSTVFNSGSINIPAPITPCFDILTLVSETPGMDSLSCPAWDGEPEPDPCEASSTQTVSDSPCQIVVSGACVDVDGSATIVIESTRACCDVGVVCANPIFNGKFGAASYVSETFDCDSVPATIGLTRVSLTGSETFSLEWGCDDGIDTPSPRTFTIPSALTLTVA